MKPATRCSECGGVGHTDAQGRKLGPCPNPGVPKFRPGIDNIDVTAASAYFEGGCVACEEPGRGTVVTVVTITPGGNATHVLRFCATHTNVLIEKLEKAGIRRDI